MVIIFSLFVYIGGGGFVRGLPSSGLPCARCFDRYESLVEDREASFWGSAYVVFYYRAACNAAAVWRGDFCLSVCPPVCPSHALIVAKR